MTMDSQFDSIRPFNDGEVHEVLERLTKEASFIELLGFLFPNIPTEKFVQKLLAMESIQQFQHEVIYPYVKQVVDQSTKGLYTSGLDKLDPKKHYLFISNHRDIVLDSAFLNGLMVENGFSTTEIAIGDNLLIYPWITDLVKINKTFIVQRNLPVRQMMESSTRLSNYIRQTIVERNQSVWLAQREGRSKDGDDRTQTSLLKMLNISGKGDLLSNFDDICIVPLSISYEYDPCDYLKAQEFLYKRDNPTYKKSQADDLKHMGAGIKGRKGRVNFAFGEPIGLAHMESLKGLPKNDQLQGIAELIDESIHNNYRLWPGNFVANDIILKDEDHTDKYTAEEKEVFLNYLNEHISRIDGDKEFLHKTLLEMYANPVKNFYEE